MTELKPCPFCGGSAKILQDIEDIYFAWCSGCEMETSGYEEEKDAIDRWNRRVK